MQTEITHWRGVDNSVHSERYCPDINTVQAATLLRGLPPAGQNYDKRDSRFVPSTFPRGWADTPEHEAEA
eukprot:11472460-Alexandrium_andersonii.AAC.1